MKNRQRGFSLVLILIALAILAFIGIQYIQRGVLNSQLTQQNYRHMQVIAAAEGELNRTIRLLSQHPTDSNITESISTRKKANMTLETQIQHWAAKRINKITIEQYLITVTAFTQRPGDSTNKGREAVRVKHMIERNIFVSNSQ